ncbi:MAG TPA: PIG-L family deacetylase [Planctomycetes bacterium]|nr:PIG-L family deacetylase [Planctomycetota bacterium]
MAGGVGFCLGLLSPLCSQGVPLGETVGLQGLAKGRQALVDVQGGHRAWIVVTHPDDPWPATALVLRRKFGMDVQVLIATMGEGGQNAVGNELGRALGAVRRRESLAAAKRLDVKVRFLGLVDFGYCRTAAEALDHWKAARPAEVLKEALEAFSPEWIFTPHSEQDAHGQKRALFYLLKREVEREGDRAPRLLRILRNPGKGEKEESRFSLEELDPIRSVTFREEAYHALLQHRTQGPHGPMEEEIGPELRLLALDGKGRFTGQGLLDFFERLGSRGKGWTKRLEALLLQGFEAPKALETLGELIALLREEKLGKRAPGSWHLDAARKAMEAAMGLRIRLKPSGVEDPEHTGQVLEIWNGGRQELRFRFRPTLSHGFSHLVSPKGLLVPSRGFLRVPLRGRLDREQPRLLLVLDVLWSGGRFLTEVHGRIPKERSVAMRVVPEEHLLVPSQGGELPLSLRISKPVPMGLASRLGLAGPPGFLFGPELRRDRLGLSFQAPPLLGEYFVSLRLKIPGWDPLGRGLRPVALKFHLSTPYEGVEAPLRLFPVRARIPAGLILGIVRGPDRTVEEVLHSFGIDVRALDARTLLRTSLAPFATVLVDSRALLLRPDLRPQIPRLLRFVEEGGHLVVLYHKPSEFNEESLGTLLAPFPLVLGKGRITREDAVVHTLLKKHPLLTRPNPIEARDWDGWVQERGLYFPEEKKTDVHYERLLMIQEPEMRELPELPQGLNIDRTPRTGALLAARSGRGSYVYCALVLHRQLRALKAGAARLLLNLITPPGWTRFR